MSQYNFYQKNKSLANSDINRSIERPKCKNPDEIRNKILEQYDLYNDMLKNDKQLQNLKNKKTTLSDKILAKYQILQSKNNGLSTSEIADLHSMLTALDNEFKIANEEYGMYIAKHLEWLKTNYIDIYERIVDEDTELSRETLEHVLNAFCQSENHTIDRKQAVLSGLDYMRQKHNLPDDFFDTSKIDQFI